MITVMTDYTIYLLEFDELLIKITKDQSSPKNTKLYLEKSEVKDYRGFQSLLTMISVINCNQKINFR